MHDQDRRSAAPAPARGPGFLTRLRKDTRGNTLAIVGAALIPLAAMIGSGVDMSRAYMAKNRLQSACDAAALAGRRIMQNDTLDQAVIDESRRFFAFNFPQGLYQTAAFTPNVTRPTAGTVRVTASTQIPNTIMRMFGYASIPLEVTCDASLNFVNTDVMLVLDTTGSMDWDINGNTTGDDSARRITALREAVMALYDELRPIQTQLESNGMRLRYGVVPYSTTVNVGRLIEQVNPDFLADDVPYQSRVFNYNTPFYEGEEGSPSAAVEEIYSGSISQSNCDKYGRNQSFSGFTRSETEGGGPAPQPTWRRGYSNDESPGVDWGWAGSSDTSGTSRACRRRHTTTTTTYPNPPRYTYTNTTYQQEIIDVRDYKRFRQVRYVANRPSSDDGSSVAERGPYDPLDLARDGQDVSWTTSPIWNGCIEERSTDPTITSTSGLAIPAEARDLDINLIPVTNDDRTRWRPQWRQVYHTPGSNSIIGAPPCPVEARRLQPWTRDAMQTYVNSLTPTGNTYHDIGIIWGARMISSAGIFADSPNQFNGMPVSRHIIFMTDGVMDTSSSVYGFQGVESNDHRVGGTPTPSKSEMDGRHVQRFRMVCNAAKSMNVSIWVVAFGSSLQPHLLDCASNANQASTAANRNDLISRFRQIGSQIGALRLTQ